jgi:hypothetical protein
MSLLDVWEQLILPMIKTPIRCSILSVYLRSCDYEDKTEVLEAIDKGIEKEISVTQRFELSPSLQFPFFYDVHTATSFNIHPDIPFRPYMQLWIRRQLHHFRSSLFHLLLTPQMSRKSIGIESTYNLKHAWSGLPLGLQPSDLATTIDLERYYADTGEYVQGPAEVRYAWKFNDLKPRIYYAIGASTYFSSRYVWAIFDRLQRAFPPSDPNQRYSFQRFPMVDLDRDIFLIYDYASFTSRLVDFKKFIDELASFLDVEVLVFDTHRGVVTANARDILRDYNRVCNMDPLFDVGRLPGVKGEDYQRVILHHRVAGMLGVFGNITGSTAMHGLVGILVAGSPDMVNTIGDDAGILVHQDDFTSIDHIFEAIRSIGEIADEKFEIWFEDQDSVLDNQSWHYTKRPINVESGLVTQKWMPEFPMISLCMDKYPSHITSCRGQMEIRRRIFIKQTCRFLLTLATHLDLVTEEDIGMTLDLLRTCYKKLRLPIYGSLPTRFRERDEHHPYPDEFLAIPPLTVDSVTRGWWQVLKERSWEGTIVNLPRVEESDELPGMLFEGLSFVYRSDRILDVLVKIGKVEKIALFEDRLCDPDVLLELETHIFWKRSALYRYNVLEECPQWETYRSLDHSADLP